MDTIDQIVEQLLLEDINDKLPALVNKTGLPEEKILQAAHADPTFPKVVYINWLLKLVKDGAVKFPEDTEKVKEALAAFDRLKKTPRFTGSKDIGSYKTYGDLSQTIDQNQGVVSKGSEKRMATSEGQEVVVDKPPYRVIRLSTTEAAAQQCRGTDWCVKDPKYGSMYLKEGPLYLVEKDGEPYVLVHEATGSVKDVYDRSVSFNVLREIAPVLKPLGFTKFDGDLRILPLASKSLSEIASDPKWAVMYAYHVIHGPWPEGEKAIVSVPKLAFEYAVYVIKGPWPEGEATIATDPRCACYYAVYVIKGPWPEGEKAIASAPKWAYDYARTVIQGPWPAGEAAIASDPKYAKAYMDKFPETKDRISALMKK